MVSLSVVSLVSSVSMPRGGLKPDPLHDCHGVAANAPSVSCAIAVGSLCDRFLGGAILDAVASASP